MTVSYTWVLGFVRERDQLYDREQIQHFLELLVDHDCYLALDIEIGFTTIWQKYCASLTLSSQTKRQRTPSTHELRAGISENLLHEVDDYCREQRAMLTFQVYAMSTTDLLRGMLCSVTLAPTEGYILWTVDAERFFYGASPGLAKYRYWVDLLRLTYRCWHPLYMHNFNHAGPPEVNPTWEQVHMLNLPRLSSFNIFGPALVAKWELQHLLAAPAWKVERLDDDGVLLIPEPAAYIKTSKNCSMEAVAQHMGFTEPESVTN